ncbi:MAG: xanthine dehydrogenase family protein subunit M [Acidobacteriia bacterium]|nr:xanthine dehydrogenase family protein subunit M [Terriglobia bacterium]
MAIAHQFEYIKPHRLIEVVKTLARYGSRAQLLAGGTDLVALIAEDAVKPEVVIDLKGLAGLDQIELKNNILSVGALVTFSDLRHSPIIEKRFPVIREMTEWVASVGIRNRATMVGNICSAVPCCDSGPILLIYDASVLVTGPVRKRKISIADWFTGPRNTALKRGEIVTGLAIPLPKKKHAACFVKLKRYEGGDLAQASMAVLALAGNSYRVAFGSVAPRPIRAPKIEAHLEGKALSDTLLEEVMRLIPEEIAPITDIRATREYRAHMIGVMLRRGLRAATSRLEGNGPEYGSSVI